MRTRDDVHAQYPKGASRRCRRVPKPARLAVCVLLLLIPAALRLPVLLTTEDDSWQTALGGSSARVNDPMQPPPPAWADARHLILVAGHAVYTASSRSAAAIRREENWYLEPYQRGQLATMLEHIKRGVALASSDNASLLVFSGGETRTKAGPRSEASSYWEAAAALDWFGSPGVGSRALLEVQARDSLENLLFSLCRFRQASGRYPSHVTVVSFAFKRRRFVELHRAAVRFPLSRFAFVGIDPPGMRLDVASSELSHSVKPFERDPYGCAQPELRAKRAARNPFRRSVGYPAAESCPELAELLAYCGHAYFNGPLPWTGGDDGGAGHSGGGTDERVYYDRD